jgi:GH24 family phage-related lysozyme (muramidase)
MSTSISPAARALILESEGLDQPSKWPGGESGITLGRGYDLGYITPAQFQADWSPHLTAGQRTRLNKALGKRGNAAKMMASEFRDIVISRAAADEVFDRVTIPRWVAITRKALQGSEILPADAFGALVSLTFNRGPAMEGDRRREMREIRDAIASVARKGETLRAAMLPSLLDGIAVKIREMKRLWVGKGLDGLLRRRDAEAALVERAG